MKWMTDLLAWVDARLPVTRAWDTHMGKYYAPKNFNFWYFFGVLSLLVLVNQLLTGIWLTMNYTPSAEEAFASVEYIMRDVDYGWLLRYMHSTGASAFFVVVYLHMFRGLMYGSYKAPRELVWIFGMTIYLILMAEAFLGYVLPWGQMSYWGAQVIVSLVGAIPVVGEDLVQWVRGDFLISGATLNRFFALHVVALPIVLLALVVMHILALHEVGSNNPDGVEIKKKKDENGVPLDGVAFHPFYTVHDLVGITVFLFVFCFVLFFMPEMGGFFLEYANFEEANGLKTPPHIAPVWYFTPFYAVLRAVTIDIGPLSSKFLGLVAMAGAIAILFVLPWLDKSPVKSMRYKGFMPRISLLLFSAMFVVLGYLGVKAPTEGRTVLAQLATVYYFAYFIQMPMFTNPLRKVGVVGMAISIVLGALLLKLSWDGADKFPLFISLFGTLMALFVAATPWLTAKDSVAQEPERVQMKGLSKAMVWGGFALFLIFTIAPIKAVAAGGAFDCGAMHCDPMEPDLTDKASLQSGAKWFANYCMGCHSAKYSRYERVADDLGIPHDLMLENMVFGDQKIGELMDIPMQADQSKAWFGATPPDLTLVARARSPEWLYTYLRNFYADETRPTGVNNRVFDKVAMPHVMLELQGLLECGPGPVLDSHGKIIRDPVTGEAIADGHCGSLKDGALKGSMSPAEFDKAIYDLVNFMEYMAEPIAVERERLGVYVLLFLAVFFVFVYLLNREYWRGIH
ncbi:ubiquinol-cytochrome c reductase [Pseudomaricurvus alcaniphilus]|uniref:ubiquinol-cytochrome c reductase n=1 Tax=Pseudomaricurvus alcaniphilus TaxID=1166482 RepID=UPI001409A3E4|nr:ubiquinol-cytochrome c reductase [Pseudomaricurvus alcaniphilus]NHN39650.1 ubiquinol-cytochrome c reductase [Pseudomaricurvus alcaniphilus]